MIETMTSVLLRLKALREEAGMTQAELADAVDVRQPTISALERGASRRIEFDLLDRLCSVLGKKLKRDVEPGELFERTRGRKG